VEKKEKKTTVLESRLVKAGMKQTARTTVEAEEEKGKGGFTTKGGDGSCAALGEKVIKTREKKKRRTSMAIGKKHGSTSQKNKSLEGKRNGRKIKR